MAEHNTIIDKLKRSLQVIVDSKNNALPFVYEDRDIQNIVVQNINAPLIMCVPITSSAVASANGLYHEQITIAVWFADKMAESNGDYSGQDNEIIIDDCKKRAFKWLASLMPQNELKLISVNGAERAYLELNDNFTGYLVNVTLEEVQGYGCKTA